MYANVFRLAIWHNYSQISQQLANFAISKTVKHTRMYSIFCIQRSCSGSTRMYAMHWKQQVLIVWSMYKIIFWLNYTWSDQSSIGHFAVQLYWRSRVRVLPQSINFSREVCFYWLDRRFLRPVFSPKPLVRPRFERFSTGQLRDGPLRLKDQRRRRFRFFPVQPSVRSGF